MSKINYDIKEVAKEDVIRFVQENHYSPVMPKLTKHWLGVFTGEEMVGVVTLGWGTQPKQTIQKIVSEECTSSDYYEIGKMCMHESQPRNSESRMLSQLVKWMKVNCPDVSFLYTLADGIMGKCGYVYQASNFYYGGEFWTDSYISDKGEKVHPRSTAALLKTNWEWHYRREAPGYKQGFRDDVHRKLLNYVSNVDWSKVSTRGDIPKNIKRPQSKMWWLTPEYMQSIGLRKVKGKMFRYIFPLNKKARRAIQNCKKTDWKLGKGVYPKEKDLAWKECVGRRKYIDLDSMPEWNLSVIEYNKKNVNRVVEFQGTAAS